MLAAVPVYVWDVKALSKRELTPLDPLAASLLSQKIFNYPPLPESEDCLYLNVFAPSTPAPAGGRAVLFWIYGGSLQSGNAGRWILSSFRSPIRC